MLPSTNVTSSERLVKTCNHIVTPVCAHEQLMHTVNQEATLKGTKRKTFCDAHHHGRVQQPDATRSFNEFFTVLIQFLGMFHLFIIQISDGKGALTFTKLLQEHLGLDDR